MNVYTLDVCPDCGGSLYNVGHVKFSRKGKGGFCESSYNRHQGKGQGIRIIPFSISGEISYTKVKDN